MASLIARTRRALTGALPPALRAALRRGAMRASSRAADVVDPGATRSYAQEGEDMILRSYFHRLARPGFYVDVGAHHPTRFSNTRLFYERGWRGINIEPNPAAAAAFREQRPRDVHLAVGVSDKESDLTYYMFSDPAVNSFDGEQAARTDAAGGHRLVGTMRVPVRRLDALLAAHLPGGVAIDFLSVDVEGHDVAVLRSNDWRRFRPSCVLVEAYGTSLADVMREPVHGLLAGEGYEPFAKTVNTVFYRDGRRAGGAPQP